MKVLALCTHPLESAATRYRIIQYIKPLAERNIELTVIPFFNKDDFASLYNPDQILRKSVRMVYLAGKRLLDSLKTRKFDALFIQREAMIFGPPIFEWLSKKIGRCPLILDLDDATYIQYVSPTYGRLGSALKFFWKTDKLIDWSETVICGNRFIAEYVENRGTKTDIAPTIVNTDNFHPIEKDKNKKPVIGWIGTHSTFPSLESKFHILSDLAKDYDFTLRIVGAGKENIKIKGVEVENLDWNLKREIRDFQTLDIGLYPMEISDSLSKEWLLGKSGFKAIQYMSVGIPYVVTPLGVTAEIGINNETHFTADSNQEWYEGLKKLLESADLRANMGKEGRKYSLENYTVPQQAEKIAKTLREAVENFN